MNDSLVHQIGILFPCDVAFMGRSQGKVFRRMTLDQYQAWALQKLPKDIPSEIVEKGLNIGGYISGLQFWQYGERELDTVIFTASDENELKHWIYIFLC